MSKNSKPYLEHCPVGCEGELLPTGYRLPEGPLLRCSECGQLVSQCSEERYWQSMQEFDDPRGTLPGTGLEDRRFRRSKKFLDRVATLLGKSAQEIRLLDVGCSSGAFLDAATKLGYQAEGVEPAARAAQTAQEAGLKVHQGLLQEAGYANGQFDAVTLFEVIEHLKEPVDLLRECQRILRPGGIMLIGTGNAASWSMAAMKERWEYLSIEQHGGHISFFSPRSIGVLAQRSGFAVADIRTRSVRLCDRSNCPSFMYTPAKIAAELLNPLAKLLDKGSDMAVYLRRT